jgi:glycosyltransferase involved in cell wall biosynthesis
MPETNFTNSAPADTEYSVVIPVYNEEGSIVSLCSQVKGVMDQLGKPYEIILVDDGSEDHSLRNMKTLRRQIDELIIISLAGHSGKSEALQCGFDNASGKIIVTLDGDGQDDPYDIIPMLDRMREGYDLVYGWRHDMRGAFGKRISSRLANFARRLITGMEVHDVGCPLRVFKKKDIGWLRLSGGLHRYFSTLMKRKGYSVGEVKVKHYPRHSGSSKYGFFDRLKEGVADLFRISFCDLDALMQHRRKYKIEQVIRGKQ